MKVKDLCYDDALQRIIHELRPQESCKPLVSWTPLLTPPFDLSFFFCSRYRRNGFAFFYEMVTRSLIPGKTLNAPLHFARDFFLYDQHFMAGEVRVRVESKKELEAIEKKLRSFESETIRGLESQSFANKVLESLGLFSHEKVAIIHEMISNLVKTRPQDFDYDIFSELQRFLSQCTDHFKEARSARDLCRILCLHYLFKKALKHSYEAFPERRYISIKLIKRGKVLGVAIGLSFLEENEVFDQRHIASSIDSLIPGVKTIAGSFFVNTSQAELPKTFYLEVEKEDGLSFTKEETAKLINDLPLAIKNRIEERHQPLFMPENEEEIMRHILSLSAQLKFVRDLPQVVINFHKQTAEKLEFLVVVCRVVDEQDSSLADLLSLRPIFLDYTFNRSKIMGKLGKKFQKEASVFRLRIQKSFFLRQNNSIDLYKAREQIANELAKIIGDFRDYNGGIISKESELFNELKQSLGSLAHEHAFSLENFFFSLHPAVMRSVLPIKPLKKLFTMVVESDSEGFDRAQKCLYRMEEDQDYFYLLLLASDSSFRKKVQKAIDDQKLGHLQLATTFVQGHLPCFGLILRKNEKAKTMALQHAIEKAMQEWEKAKF